MSEIRDVPVLDQAAWAALTGPHARLAEGTGLARRYPTDVSPFAALPPAPDERAWADLRALAGPGGTALLAGDRLVVPAGWTAIAQVDGVQLVATDAVKTEPDVELVPLGDDDVPEMLDLVARTRPGPFLPKTHHLGAYAGVRHDGALIAMAGERLHPPGYTEISAVCTDPAFRGRGLATRLIRAIAHGIRERGETPFLHASADNVGAIRLYETMGFELRRTVTFNVLRAA
ncbi:GNAT family N-acetyltransferase [Dactylosporangium sp. CS-047395]|uniref:GNAT family N-acetyltransferase n=1 Tax=Dactylosporangium sp. CS-047395 TaxID=3239936 RepID=UPI003D8B4EDC